MKSLRKIVSITEDSATIELPSLNKLFKIPIDVFKKFSKKKVRIKIEVIK